MRFTCRYARPKYIDELYTVIQKQCENLKVKLDSNNNSVLRDLAITEFLIGILSETNKITPFKYVLKMEDTDN